MSWTSGAPARMAVLGATLLMAVGCSRTEETVRKTYEPTFPPLENAGSVASRDGESEAFTFAEVSARTRFLARVGPSGQMPPQALERAIEQMEAMRRRQPYAAGVYPGSWTSMGPGQIGGRTRAVIIHPTQPNTMWIGTAGGGIWRTDDGGANWRPLDDFMASIAIGCMAIDPATPTTLYAGTGEGFFDAPEGTSNTATMRGSGIYRTLDGGQNWDRMPSTDNADFWFVNRIVVHPTNPQIVFAATATGIYRSTNGGNSWTQRVAGRFLDVQIDPTNLNRMVASMADVNGYYSTDGGLTWALASGLGGQRHEFAWSVSQPGTVYCARSNNGSITIYRSTNGGQSYTLRTSGSGITTYDLYNSCLWVDPTNVNTLIFGGVYLYRSTDGGVTRAQAFTSVHADMHAIVSNPGFNGTTNKTLYIGCDGGVYRVTDAYGSATTRINNNLSITQFYGAAVHDGTGVIVAGAQDNGTNRFNGNPLSWNENVIGGDGAFCASDPTNSNYFYGASQYANIRRSSNGGTSYTGIAPPGAGSSNNFNFIPYFLLDPNESNRMLVCGELLWRNNAVRTTNTWTSIKPSIRPSGNLPVNLGGKQAHFAGNNPWNISTATVAHGNSNVIWVGHNDGHLYKTTNGTATTPTWTRVDENGIGLPDRWISRIVIDRVDPSRVTLSLMGWEPDNLWRTTDAGATWAPVVGGGLFALPSVPVSALAQHRTKPGYWYAGTDLGIFTSSDDGASWTSQTDGPGTVPIDELVWKNDNTLMAVTHGRGVYLGSVSATNDPFSPVSFAFGPGLHNGGRLASLFQSDDAPLTGIRNLAQDELGYDIQLVCEGIAPIANLTALSVKVEAKVTTTGAVQAVDVYDFVAGAYVRVSTTGATLSDSVVTVNVPGPAQRFVQPGTRRVRVRMGWSEVAQETVTAWRAHVDQLLFTATP